LIERLTMKAVTGVPRGLFDPSMRAKILLASLSGFIIGLVAGLLGVGGGEFRLPVLISLIGFPVAIAAAANLLIGILTVVVGLARRLMVGITLSGMTSVIVSMSAASIVGAYAGAFITDKVKEKYLKAAVGVLLVSIGLKMIYDAFAVESPVGLAISYPMELFLAGAIGALIGVASGALGVAGGELRIPALIYIFNLPIKVAGTASLLVSVPTVATGAFKHVRMGHVGREVVLIFVAMAVPSVFGAFLGGTLVIAAGENFLKALLGVVLLLATVRIVKP
jgi:uncharacterized membrane protein YfcA